MIQRHRQIFFCSALAAAAAVAGFLPASWGGDNTPTPAGVTWETNYDDALAAAHAANKPLLVVLGAPWCEACRQLNEQLKLPEAQNVLATMPRVYVDFDSNHDLARKLGIGPIPAMRVIKPSGRTVALHEGVMKVAEFAGWLKAAKEASADTAFDPTLDTDDLSDDQVVKLVALFGNPEAAVREEAIRKLLAHRAKAATPVVGIFAKGTLAERLTALDLLESWKAPVDKLDPWRTESFTKEPLAALSLWAAAPVEAAATAPALDDRQRADARDLLGRYLQSSDDSAAPLRERLARYGAALLPDIYAALKDAATDPARERLTMLRYRVVVSDALAMQWPIGIELLASSQVKMKHSALEELSNRAGPRDTALLLELFSDSDALVRETALRLLQKVGGPSATDALTGLLADPDPNVRAAVLKSIADAPTAQIAAKVADYITKEQDIDLIVHAARVLHNANSPLAIKTLYALLGHASWRVRAEVAEALSEKVGYRSSASPEQTAEFYVRMLQLLDDSDGFVASRAMSGLEHAEGLPSTAKIVAAATVHPELVFMAIKVISNNFSSDPKAAGYIKGYLSHADPSVRAAALETLVASLGSSMADDLHHALTDSNERVRSAAADSILQQLSAAYSKLQDVLGDNSSDPEPLLGSFQSGKGRPKWLEEFEPDLEKDLASASPDERIHMALPLLALGHRELALPAVKKLVGSDSGLNGALGAAIQWLPWDDRLALFNDLKKDASPEILAPLAARLAEYSGPQAFDVLWDLLGTPQANWNLVGSLESGLRRLLMGNDYYRGLSPAQNALLIVNLTKRMTAGNELQKSVALALMSGVDVSATLSTAGKIMADPSAAPALKHDALQIQVNYLPQADAETLAVHYLAGERALRDVALAVLTGDERSLEYLNGNIYISGGSSRYFSSTGVPVHPGPPKGLKIDQAQKLLQDEDPRVAAIGGYLLALLNDRSGLDKLLDYYHKNAVDHDYVCRMVYRAISALDDDSYTPVLTEIYKSLGKSSSSDLREFYWTIRSMTGDKCLELRRHIRDESGAEILR